MSLWADDVAVTSLIDLGGLVQRDISQQLVQMNFGLQIPVGTDCEERIKFLLVIQLKFPRLVKMSIDRKVCRTWKDKGGIWAWLWHSRNCYLVPKAVNVILSVVRLNLDKIPGIIGLSLSARV